VNKLVINVTLIVVLIAGSLRSWRTIHRQSSFWWCPSATMRHSRWHRDMDTWKHTPTLLVLTLQLLLATATTVADTTNLCKKLFSLYTV